MKIYVLYNVIAEIRNGKFRIIIDEPIEQLKMEEFVKNAKCVKFMYRVKNLKELIKKRENGTLELASKNEPVRLGGGMLQIENNKIILIKRDDKATRMPLSFDIPAGIYDIEWTNPFQMIVAESVEVVRMQNGILYYPSIGLYENTLLEELEKVAKALKAKGIKIEDLEKIDSIIETSFDSTVEEIIYLGDRLKNLLVTFEYNTPSIELLGIIRLKKEAPFKYADGELVKGYELLNREIHVINLNNLEDRVWKLFKIIRKNHFYREMMNSRGFTSKAALASLLMGLISRKDLETINKIWDIVD